MPATRRAPNASTRNWTAAGADSPASSQRLKAQTMTGSRSSGRSCHSRWAMVIFGYPALSGAQRNMERVETVADLIPGREVEGVYACVRKDRLTARTGSPYLALELRDRTGSLPARVFRDADFLAGQFERGDLVWVAGRVERFRDALQLDVATIRK